MKIYLAYFEYEEVDMNSFPSIKTTYNGYRLVMAKGENDAIIKMKVEFSGKNANIHIFKTIQ